MKHIRRYISEAFSWQEAKNYLFECLDRTDDYNFELTLESCPKLADYYCLSELNISREFRNHPEYIYLALIVVNEEDQYSGYGTGFMEDLCEWADTRGKIITLTPDDDFGASSVSRLIKFYKRFGFVENKGKNTDFTHKQFMHRKPNVTEAVARRKTGKYSRTITDLTYSAHMTYTDIANWVEENGIEIVDIGNYHWLDISRNLGKGVALKGHGYTSYSLILCPIRDHEHAYSFSFHNGEDEVEDSCYYTKEKSGVMGHFIETKQLVEIINKLDRETNFVTEAVANRRTGKYVATPIGVGMTLDEFEEFLRESHIDLKEERSWNYGFGCGDGICHVFDMKGNRKGYVEYIVCPKHEKFRFNVRFSMGRFDCAYIEDEIAGKPSANLARGYAEVLEKLYDYYK